MAKRPSLADSLRASLTKGVHVETAEKLAQSPTLHVEEHPESNNQTNNQSNNQTSETTNEQSRHQSTEQSTKHVDHQTNNSDNDQANKQDNEQAVKQLNSQSSNQTVEQAVEPTINQVVGQSFQQVSSIPSHQSIEQSPQQAISQTVERTYEQSHQPSINRTVGSLPQQSIRNKWYPLNENQGRILLFLYEYGGGLTNMEIICSETLIAYGTARNAVDVLKKEGYITGKERHVGHSFRGFVYSLNNHLCSLYVSRVNGGQSPEQSIQQTIKQLGSPTISIANQQTNRPVNNQTISPISSSSFSKATTTESQEILIGAELIYWVENGLQERQAKKWCEELEIAPEELRQQLAWARYDLVNNGKEQGVQNILNWIYGVLRKTAGCYPRPDNYKSPTELRLEKMKEQSQREEVAKKELKQLQVDQRISDILNNPGSPEYNVLRQGLNSFELEMPYEVLKDTYRRIFIENGLQ